MTHSAYKRASRTDPCLICGKPDWCSRTLDGSISFCARVTTSADRLNRKEQWGVFYHNQELLNQAFWKISEPRNFQKSEKPEVIPAPLEVRDFAYQTLLRISPASNFPELTLGKKGLLERRLENFRDYGGLPGSITERKYLAAQIRDVLNRHFPSFIRENPDGICQIPGFWIDDFGETNLWLGKDYAHPLLLIPYRNPVGKIQGCQMRFTGKPLGNKKRYLWLSVPNNSSAGSGTPLHFAGWRSFKVETPLHK